VNRQCFFVFSNLPWCCRNRPWLGRSELRRWGPDVRTCTRCRTSSTCCAGTPGRPPAGASGNLSDSEGCSRWAGPQPNLSWEGRRRNCRGCRPRLLARAWRGGRLARPPRCSCKPCWSKLCWRALSCWVTGRGRGPEQLLTAAHLLVQWTWATTCW